MCIVSMISDYGRDKFSQIDISKWIKPYQELIAKGKEVDRVTGQPDCESTEKTKWLVEIEQRALALEKEKEDIYALKEAFSAHLSIVRATRLSSRPPLDEEELFQAFEEGYNFGKGN